MKILYFTPSIGNGGVEKMMFEWMSRLVLKGYSFDIITNEIISDKYYKIFNNIADNIYTMPYHQLRLDKKIQILRNVLKKGDYDIFHVHSCFSFDFWMMAVAKAMNVKVRIIHSHNSNVTFRLKATKLLNEISKPFLRYFSTNYLACGVDAGLSLLGNTDKVRKCLTIMENGIDIQQYIPQKDIRFLLRKELCINNEYIIGTVGRLSKQKNYSFLIDVFYAIYNFNKNCRLLIVGSGEEAEILKQKTIDLKIEDKVIFLGERSDVANLLQTMDVFVLTSLFEGLGISMLEAQCSGLHCVASQNIPEEVNISGNVEFLSLEKSKEEWAKIILSKCLLKRDSLAYKKILNAGYDIDSSTEKLEKYYCNQLQNG